MVKKLTEEGFFKVLKKRRKLHGFHMQDGSIREKVTGCCPVVAVAHELGCSFDTILRYWLVAPEIGLSAGVAESIADSSDCSLNTLRKSKKKTKTKERQRRRLLRLLGLKERVVK